MPTNPSSSGPIPLDYAPAQPRWRKRVGRILLGLILLATAFCAWRWGPYAWHQSQLLYWQRQCMNFSAPPDMVVYEEEPAAAALLLKASDYSPYPLKRNAAGGPTTAVKAAAFYPRCWRMLATLALVPNWNSRVPGNVGAVLFLHQRISLVGHHRLVGVAYMPGKDTFTPQLIAGYNYNTRVASPATLTKPFVDISQGYAYDVISGYPRSPPLTRFYAGQPDPNDPAHFTIRYQMWGQEDVLDGRLLDNDQITLTPRHTPGWPKQ